MDDSINLNKTILLADDDQFILVAYKDGLTRAGYRVVAAQDGEEALNILKTLEPDLILLDLIMPKVNGFEVLQKVKSSDRLKDIPVIVLTNLSQDSDENEVRSFGVNDFLVKADVSLKDLLDRVKVLLA